MMSKNFICKGCGETFEKNMESSTPNYCYICNEFYMKQKIAQLEHRLSNCIELPKYEKGQKIYYIRGGKIEEAYFQRFNNWITADVILNPHEVTDDDGYTDVDYDFDMVSPEQMFKTREDAEKKLGEISQ